jgi:hypothetical protein
LLELRCIFRYKVYLLKLLNVLFCSSFLIYCSIDLSNSFLKVLVAGEDCFGFILLIFNSIVYVIRKVGFELIKGFISEVSSDEHYLYLSWAELEYVKMYVYITLDQEGPELMLVSMIDIRSVNLKWGMVCTSDVSLRVVQSGCDWYVNLM